MSVFIIDCQDGISNICVSFRLNSLLLPIDILRTQGSLNFKKKYTRWIRGVFISVLNFACNNTVRNVILAVWQSYFSCQTLEHKYHRAFFVCFNVTLQWTFTRWAVMNQRILLSCLTFGTLKFNFIRCLRKQKDRWFIFVVWCPVLYRRFNRAKHFFYFNSYFQENKKIPPY